MQKMANPQSKARRAAIRLIGLGPVLDLEQAGITLIEGPSADDRSEGPAASRAKASRPANAAAGA